MIDHGARGLSQHRSRFLLIALVAILAISVMGGVRCYLRTADAAENASLRKLAKTVGGHRLTRARLSGGFDYAACQADSSADRLVSGLVCNGPPPASWSTVGNLRKLAVDMRISGKDGGVPPDAHTLGVWQLVWGNVDEAVADLREAVRRQPSNARALNDLAVALTEFAQRHDDPSALIDAFVAADSAVRLDSSLAEATFTQAVLLEHLYLQKDAAAAWQRYLRLDASSQWANEAGVHLKRLESRPNGWANAPERLQSAASAADLQTIRSIVVANPSETRALIEDQLGAWSAAIIAGDSAKSSALLDFARTLAEPLRIATGDALLVDAVAAIDRANAQSDRAQFRALAEGHAALAAGLQAFRKFKYREATVSLATAQKLLARGASPMSGWASLFEARSHIVEPKRSTLATLTALRHSTPGRYLVLRSSAAQYVGFIYDIRSDYVHSIAAYDSALLESRTTGESQITLRVGSWLSQEAGVIRGREAGWRALYSALAAVPRYSANDRSVYTVFDYAAMAIGSHAPRLSLRFCDELIRVANHLSDPATVSVAFGRRAEQLAKMGENGRARADISAAMVAARQISDSTFRTRGITDVTLVSGYIALRSSPKAAEPALRSVVDDYKAAKYEKGLGPAYLYLAQSSAASGKIESARAAFDSATELMQRQRETVSGPAERGAFLDDARATIDQIMAFHAGQNARDAFEYFERTRSRVLLEQLTDSRGQLSGPPERVLVALQRRLSGSDVVLSYAVLPTEILIWTIGSKRFEMHRVSIAASELEELVHRVQRSILDPAAEPDAAASERLHRLLVDSAGQIEREANLTVIPDRWLHFVPFAALRDGATRRFLVQDHSVTYAPSATLLVSTHGEPRRSLSRSSRVLAFGNPKFDPRVFQLPDLPAAEREADAIADLYGHQKAVVRVDATDAALERMAPSSEILHFAGHAVVGRDAPQLSHLVLASDGRSDGAVFASEIAHWKLPRTRLVILSGCSTGDGKLSATEGASSLARAFFAAGVPAVLSSLWAIDDNETADFFIAFHRRLAQGHPAAVALRETQIEWLGDTKSHAHVMSSWAAFQLFGG